MDAMDPTSLSLEAAAPSDTWHWTPTLSELRRRTGGWNGPLSLSSFTIAGVQEFLQAARTTRDVWNGSYLLSYLAFRGAMGMLESIAAGSGKNWVEVLDWAVLPAIREQPLIQKEAGLKVAGDLSVANFPNSILMLAPGGLNAGLKAAAAAKRHVEQAWGEIVTECLKMMAEGGRLHELKGTLLGDWNYQTVPSRVLEMYGSAVELPPDEHAYRRLVAEYPMPPSETAYSAVAAWSGMILGARKMLRDFEQIGERGHRCSLCGARAALADYGEDERDSRTTSWRKRRDKRPFGKLRAYWKTTRSCDELRHKFRPEERLCAVCVVRRLAAFCYFPKKIGCLPSFPSTSKLAMAQELATLLDSVEDLATLPDGLDLTHRLTEFIDKIETGLRDCVPKPPNVSTGAVPYLAARFEDSPAWVRFAGVEGEWFYQETYDPRLLAAELDVPEGDVKERFPLTVLSDLREALKRAGRLAAENYYALIALDGDKMGDWISGSKAREQFSPSWQLELSKTLAQFSKRAREIVECTMPGKLVYAGGDDVLAFVPRSRMLEAMQSLDDAFADCTRNNGKLNNPQITISMACILARHNDPLSSVIELSRRHLKETAKEKYGRNAFAIHRTTSGFVTGASVKPGRRNLLHDLGFVLESMRAKRGLSGAIAYDLRAMAGGLGTWVERPEPYHAPLMARQLEAQSQVLRYLVGRHFRGDPRDENEITERLVQMLAALHQWTGELRTASQHKADVNPFETLVNLLATLRFLSRGEV